MNELDETTAEAPVVDDEFSKARDAFKGAADKIEDFASDERVQEIATKAGEFAKDVLGQVFDKMGDKLKEIKKEKEDRKKQES